MRGAAEEYVRAFVAEAIGSPAGVRVSVAAVHGTAAEVLVSASERAALLVVGSRGRGGLRGLLGSVSHECAQHARCPVVILRGSEVEARPFEELEEVAGDAG